MANTAPDAMKMTAFSLTHGVISEAEKKKKISCTVQLSSDFSLSDFYLFFNRGKLCTTNFSQFRILYFISSEKKCNANLKCLILNKDQCKMSFLSHAFCLQSKA